MASAISSMGSPRVIDMSAANTRFTLDLLRQCGGGEMKNKNLFLGPYTVSTALAMAYLGARGETGEEMRKVLRWSSPTAPTEGYSSYLKLLKESSDTKNAGYFLVGSQRIYVSDRKQMRDEFSASTKEDFLSEAQSANFVDNPDGERIVINDCVSAETKGKIKDLLPENSITDLTVMVLVQAMYFKGSWLHKFDAKETDPRVFFAPGGEITVSMMSQIGCFKNGTFPDLSCKAVELPYASNDDEAEGGDLSMLVLLPDTQDGIDNLEETLTFDALTNICKNLHTSLLQLRLPRFKVESSFKLKEVLKKLGMPLTFSDGGDADFSGLVEGSGPGDIFISNVFHKAVMEVNEEGSEAAAATAVGFRLLCCHIAPLFNADHPFLFFIVDKRADVVLFSGRVASPPSV